MIDMKNELLEKFQALIYENCGIHQDKPELLLRKLEKLIRKYQLSSYQEYYQLITTGDKQRYWREFIDEITVHKSGFFRENHHFEFIRGQLRTIFNNNPRILKNNEIKIWSAGSSTGEEPYTIAMVLKEWLPEDMAIKILAVDISSRSLAFAQNGIYDASIKKDMDPYYLMRYFTRSGEEYTISSELKSMITFRLFNLMDPFPFRDNFDIIFCRNVMIYFDLTVQQELIQKFYEYLVTGGLLFIGHSESLFNKQHRFQYIQPTIYMK